jgi:hypothetical protein
MLAVAPGAAATLKVHKLRNVAACQQLLRTPVEVLVDDFVFAEKLDGVPARFADHARV